MIYSDKRPVINKRQSFCRIQPYKKTPDKPGAYSSGKCSYIFLFNNFHTFLNDYISYCFVAY